MPSALRLRTHCPGSTNILETLTAQSAACRGKCSRGQNCRYSHSLPMPQAGAWPGGMPLPPGLTSLNGLPPSLPMLPPQVWQKHTTDLKVSCAPQGQQHLHTLSCTRERQSRGSQMAGLQQPAGMGLPGGLPPAPFGPRCAAAPALHAETSRHLCAGSWHDADNCRRGRADTGARCLLGVHVQARCGSPGAGAWHVWRC